MCNILYLMLTQNKRWMVSCYLLIKKNYIFNKHISHTCITAALSMLRELTYNIRDTKP